MWICGLTRSADVQGLVFMLSLLPLQWQAALNESIWWQFKSDVLAQKQIQVFVCLAEVDRHTQTHKLSALHIGTTKIMQHTHFSLEGNNSSIDPIKVWKYLTGKNPKSDPATSDWNLTTISCLFLSAFFFTHRYSACATSSILFLAAMYIKGNDVTKLASMAKLKGGRLAREVADGCLQYWGGMGFTSEVQVSRFYRWDWPEECQQNCKRVCMCPVTWAF